jgi:hypothetical protein
MILFSFYSIIISTIILITIVIVAICYKCFNRINRHGLPKPNEVFVITQPHQQEIHYPQVFWSSTVEQPPPPYHVVIQGTDISCNTTHENNKS